MEAVKRAASEAVETIRNSPLFRRKFGTYQKTDSDSEEDEMERSISPEKDLTPFVQGIYFEVDYLGKRVVEAERAQDHGVTDEVVELFWGEAKAVERVTVRVATTNLRVKQQSDGTVTFDFPLFRVSYCGTDKHHKEAFSFVAKENDDQFYCYVFRCANKEKAHALALSVAKAFYLAYQILQEQQGEFHDTPERERLFEPQKPDDTKVSPHRPHIPETESPWHPQLIPEHAILDVTDGGEISPPPALPPTVRVLRPSLASLEDHATIRASVDDDFTRLAKARSNPDILRSTLDHSDVRSSGLDLVHLHADPGSQVPTPMGSPHDSVDDLTTED